MSTWGRFITFAVYAPFGRKRAVQRSERFQERLDRSHQAAALISGLVEFQKCQAFFAITLQATALAALVGDGIMFDAKSIQQLHLTADLLGDVAATGIICLTFGLYILHAACKRSWYTTSLTVIAMILCLAVWIVTHMALPNLYKVSPAEHKLPACGGMSPATFCLNRDGHGSTAFEATCITICLLTTILMMFRQCKALHGLRSRHSSVTTSSKPGSLRRVSTVATTKAKEMFSPVTTRVYNWRLEIAECVFGTMTLIMLIQLITSGEMRAMREKVQWTFAQLIAVTIWAPPIIEYLYAALRKWSLTSNRHIAKHIVTLTNGEEEGGDGERLKEDVGVQTVDFEGDVEVQS